MGVHLHDAADAESGTSARLRGATIARNERNCAIGLVMSQAVVHSWQHVSVNHQERLSKRSAAGAKLKASSPPSPARRVAPSSDPPWHLSNPLRENTEASGASSGYPQQAGGLAGYPPGPLRDALASPASLTAAAIVPATPRREPGRCCAWIAPQSSRTNETSGDGSHHACGPSPVLVVLPMIYFITRSRPLGMILGGLPISRLTTPHSRGVSNGRARRT